jgi:GxxExxY protein
MKRRDAETPREDRITDKIIGAAIEIHRVLDPGLLESAYEECLCYELSHRGLQFKRQVPLPVTYKGIKLACGYKMDLLVDDLIIVELKTVETLLSVHSAQLLSYLRLSGKPVGLLINFHTPVLKSGLKRIVNHFSENSASRRLGVEKVSSEDAALS